MTVELPDMHDGDLASLLAYLKLSRGFDFTGYKVTSLGRRIQKRMSEVESRAFPTTSGASAATRSRAGR